MSSRLSSLTTAGALALAALMFLGAIVSGGAASAAAHGPEGARRGRCTNATLRGDYGFTARGFTLPGSPVPAPLQGPFASSSPRAAKAAAFHF